MAFYDHNKVGQKTYLDNISGFDWKDWYSEMVHAAQQNVKIRVQ